MSFKRNYLLGFHLPRRKSGKSRIIEKSPIIFCIAVLFPIILCFSKSTSLAQNHTEISLSPLNSQGSISPQAAAQPVIPLQSEPKTIQASSVFQRYSVEDGLSHSTINCILQDTQGFMWFGTDDGLNRFDGYSFKVYRNDPADPESISHNTVMALAEDDQGYLWIGTYGGGLDRFNPGQQTFNHFRYQADDPNSLSDNRVRSLLFNQSGILWIATHGGGVNTFDTKSGHFTVLGYDPENTASAKGWLVDNIYEDRDGNLWIGSNDMGLYRFDQNTGVMKRFVQDPNDAHSLTSNNLLSAIIKDNEGKLWVGSFQGLSVLSKDEREFTQYWQEPDNPHSLSHNTINALLLDHTGTLWIATADGLASYKAETNSFVTFRTDPRDPHSLSNNLINSLYEDSTGDLWIGTRGGGLNRLDRFSARFNHVFSIPDDHKGLNNNIVNAILDDGDGVIWIGTFGGGLNRWERATDEWHHYQNDPNDPLSLGHDVVNTILQDEQGTIWLGTLLGEINRFDPNADTFERNPFNFSESERVFTNAGIRAMIQDQEHVIWIGTHGDGLYSIDTKKGSIAHYLHNPEEASSLSNNWVYSLLEDSSGSIWVGTRDAGLNKLEGSKRAFSHYFNDPNDPFSLGTGAINVIFQDRSGGLWIGTEGGGLNRMDRGSGNFVRYGSAEGFPSNAIYAIQEDSVGWLWISTGNGLVKFDPIHEIIKPYSRRDGLQGDIFIAGASAKGTHGEMYFGGFNGINYFYPEQIIDNTHVPPIVLTSLTQAGEPMELDFAVERLSELQLQRPASHFEFEFAALDFNQPDKNQYAYQLEGYDDDWIRVDKQRFGLYANLPAGTYSLHIIGSNNDGVWNETGLILDVTVLPSTWETWWFWTLVGMIVIGTTFTAYYFRTRVIAARNRLLEDQVAARTHELEALNAVAAVVSRSMDLSTVLANALEKTIEYTSAEAGVICLFSEDTPTQDDLYSKNEGPLEVKAQIGFNAINIKELEGTVLNEILSYPPVRAETEQVENELKRHDESIIFPFEMGSLLVVPMVARKQRLGYLIGNYPKEKAISEQERDLLASIGLQIGVAVENARLYAQSQAAARIQERQRLARDLHDSVTQALYGVMLYSDAAAGYLEQDHPDIAQNHIRNLQTTAQQALAEMRLLIHELRPAVLERDGLETAIANRLESVEGRAGLKTRFQFELESRLDAQTEEGLYRITQEALNNVLKHAHAKSVLISLQKDDGDVYLEIRDDGVGFEPARNEPGGLGLASMRERATALGGNLEIVSSPENGTRILVEVPYVNK